MWKYKIQPLAIRSIGNREIDVRIGEVRVSFDRRDTPVGENVHISALERLGRSAPYCERSNHAPYLPRNLISILADLHDLYCGNVDRDFALEAIRIVDWDGTIVSERDQAAEDKKKAESFATAKLVIEAAITRLLEHGIDVLHPEKNTEQTPSWRLPAETVLVPRHFQIS